MEIIEFDIKFENITMYYPNDKPLLYYKKIEIIHYINFFKNNPILYNKLLNKYNEINNYNTDLLRQIKFTKIMLNYIELVLLIVKIKLIKNIFNDDLVTKIFNYI